MSAPSNLVILGCGYTGEATARLARARGLKVIGTVRDPKRASRLRDAGYPVIVAPKLSLEIVAPLVNASVHVVATFPPDGETDSAIAEAMTEAAAITYISSTSVYGDHRGEVDDETPIAREPNARAARLIEAESIWRKAGATILRCPAIYGPDRGLHRRIIRGEHRIGGDGTAFTSRVHVEDLAQLILASSSTHGETFVVGDLAPATQNEIAEWVASEYGVPLPPKVPIEEVHETLRSDRRVNGSRALEVLEVTLKYPHYRDGMKAREAESR